jgi:hypothetical protein
LKLKEDMQESIKIDEEKYNVLLKENTELSEKYEKLKKAKEENVVLKSKLEDLNKLVKNFEEKRVEVDTIKYEHLQTISNLEKTYNVINN